MRKKVGIAGGVYRGSTCILKKLFLSINISMFLKLSEINLELSQALDIQNYSVLDRSDRILGQVVDALLDEQRNFQFLIVDLDRKIANKQVLIPWQGEGIEINSKRVYVSQITEAQTADLPSYNPVSSYDVPGLAQSKVSDSKLSSTNSYFDPTEIIGQLEYCAPLEASAPLESSVFLTSLWQINNSSDRSQIAPNSQTPKSATNLPIQTDMERGIDDSLIEPTTLIVPTDLQKERIDAQIINLLQERLIVDRQRRKVGEVIVRKEIETRIVEVPVRREKLIVEQISPERKQLVALDLGLTTNDSVRLVEEVNLPKTASYEFDSPEAAREFLQTLNTQSQPNPLQIRIDLTLTEATE
jgi:stress response protein YsnF